MQESFGPESTPDEQASQEAGRAGGDDSNTLDREVPKPKTRRRRKLTDEVQTEICAMISVGCSKRTAARLAGCSEAAIRNLSRHDEVFAARLRQACQRREIFPLRNIINASQTHWRAAAWYLSRLNPEVYGYRKPETVTPRVIEKWTTALAKDISAAIQDPATIRRILEVFKRLAPSPDPRHEMRQTKMPPPYDFDFDDEEAEEEADDEFDDEEAAARKRRPHRWGRSS